MRYIVIIILVALLALRFFFFFSSQHGFRDGEQVEFTSRLTEEPKISGRGQQFSLRAPGNEAIYLSTTLFPRLQYGDFVSIKGKIAIKQTKSGRKIFTAAYPKIKRLDRGDNLFSSASTFIRQRSTLLYNKTLDPISSDLLLGIVFGAKANFPQDFMQNLRTTGVLHVIAASGMNVSFFTGAVMFSLGTVFTRRISLLLSVIAVIFYSFLVGFQASILRASIMAIIAFTASFFGRQNLAIIGLFSTGAGMLLYDPGFIFDVGFQLSFMATLGILLLKPMIDAIKGFERVKALREDFSTTLAAQLATFPILLGTFGMFGILSVLVNVLVLWTVPLLMLLGSLAVIVGLVVPLIGQFLLLLCLPFLLFFETIVSFFGSLGWNLSVESFPWQLAVGYYLVLGAVVSKRIMKHESRSKENPPAGGHNS